MPPEAWRFLTGEARATRELADAVGFGFQAQAGAYLHPPVLVVLGAGGRVTHYFHGLTYVPGELLQALRQDTRALGSSGQAWVCAPAGGQQQRSHTFSYP